MTWMINCRTFVERVTDYVERRVSLPERVRMRMHLIMCSVCRAFFRQMKETAHATHAAAHAPVEAMPPALAQRLLDAADPDER